MRAQVGETFINDDADNVCFACSPHNSQGLRLSFIRTGEHTVETHYAADSHLCGMQGVVHGGIQATLLDEVMGSAAQCGFEGKEAANLVTVEFQIRYRRPAPSRETLIVRGEFDRIEGRDVHVKGSIFDADGELLTSATARWRRIS
jgi:uncharacterized protein (TIGR00369 family)